MLRNNIQYRYISPGSCCCEHECSCFNLIRDHRIFCAVETLYTTDLDHVCTCSSDVGSHAVQEVCNVYNVRLFRNIFQNGKSFCHSCCHHNIDGCSNTYNVKINMFSNKTVCFCNNLAMFDIYICTKCTESFEMLVNWSASDIASSWKCNFGTSVLSK